MTSNGAYILLNIKKFTRDELIIEPNILVPSVSRLVLLPSTRQVFCPTLNLTIYVIVWENIPYRPIAPSLSLMLLTFPVELSLTSSISFLSTSLGSPSTTLKLSILFICSLYQVKTGLSEFTGKVFTSK